MKSTFLILLASVVAVAQTPSNEDLLNQKRAAEALYSLAAGVGGSGPLIKSKPFMAEALTETVQKLIDGNRIVRHNATKLYRDSSGRTRREQTISALSPSSPIVPGQIVFISDPVASVDYILDESRKTVRKVPHFNSPAPTRPQSMPIGSRNIEGLECTGSKTVVTIPAGAIGNERPIVTVTINWYAPSIEELVRSTTNDPRFGETIYTLHNIVLGEPPSELFKPPAGYQVQP